MARPKLDEEQKRTNKLQMSFNDEEYAFLQAEAQRNRQSIASLLRHVFSETVYAPLRKRIPNAITINIDGRHTALTFEEANSLLKEIFQKLQAKVQKPKF